MMNNLKPKKEETVSPQKVGFSDFDLILLKGAEDKKCLETCAEFYKKGNKAAETNELPKGAFRQIS